MTDGHRLGAGRRWWLVFGVTWATELRRFARERGAVVGGFLLPVAIATLVGAGLGGDPELRVRLAVVDLDGGPVASAFVGEVLGARALDDVLTLVRVPSRAAAVALVEAGDADAGLVLPEGLSRRVTESGDDRADRGPVPALRVLRSPDHPVAGDLAALLADQFAVRRQATVAAGRVDGDGRGGPAAWPLAVQVGAPGGERLDGGTSAGPPVAVFHVLVMLGFGAHRLALDRQRGLVERLAAAPVPGSAVVTGRAAAGIAAAALSMAVLVATLQLVFGQSWGPLLPLAVVVGATVLGMAGVASVIAAVTRTPGQVQSVGVGVALAFMLASGSLSLDGPRPRLAGLVPTTPAVDALALLATEQAGMGAVAGPVLHLLAFAAVGLLAGVLLGRRSLA